MSIVMNWLRNLFLRAKHWQIFLIFAATMLLAQIAMFNSMQLGTVLDFGKGLLAFWRVTWLSALCFNVWFWAMGSFLNAIVGQRLRPSLGLFRFALIYPLLYLPIFMISFPQQPALLAIILPLHLIAMFCGFYLLNFVARNLSLAEMGKRVRFSDYAGTFFLLWFFPLGVWIVQPKINRLCTQAGNHEILSERPAD